MTKLYLVRHGETFDNERQIMQGQTQGELNPTGIRQAEALSRQLADICFDAIVASDLWRSVHTARILAEPHGLEVVTTPLLRERDWGSFTGRFIPNLKDVKPWPDDIESLPAMMDRAGRFLDYVRDNYPDCQVLAVGHGIINKAIQAVYWHKEMYEIEKMKNVEVRILDI
ncbi:histidine phosphatase family protein [Prevotella sp. E2-28]|uniref:histidine phosphatase family protein n=1 Tax=Prevotella sp. E2-28 TaxID=2913620 RepID=UPI001EDC23C1|nr:histidine phosphatase family protein [Prevotella sp. E2-28]UKK52986.1 histidine phosphatase family protein [Prevotella sp. E2-28]